jgi:NDP-sugar pyrophosphorylase family protein
MLNIVIPMAGRGSRFTDAGYTQPKPFIPIHGVPMIKVVIDNLTPKREHLFIIVCQNQHIKKYDLRKKFMEYAGNIEVIGIDGITEGQICTVLKAKGLINSNDPLMTANADQYIDFNINDYLEDAEIRKLDGLIMTMKSNDPKWSYVRINENGVVLETAEKKVISDNATVGIYYFRHGKDLVWAAEMMIRDDERVNNEFYTCPCYNY